MASEPSDDTNAIDNTAMYHDYANRFKQLFRYRLKESKDGTTNGTLICDAETVEKAPKWYNGQRGFIHSLIGTQPPVLVLQKLRGPQNIGTTNHNKTQMLRVYPYALQAYDRVCAVLGPQVGRMKLSGYTAPSLTSSHMDPHRQEEDEFHSAILQMSLKMESRCPARAHSPPVHTSKSDSKGDRGRAAKVTEDPRALPVRFGSHEEYVSVMSPLVLEEIRAEVRVTLLFLPSCITLTTTRSCYRCWPRIRRRTQRGCRQ
jgi:hypothetical protein